MHESGVAQIIIKQLLHQLQCERISRVLRISFRRSSVFPEEVLRQTFEMLSVDTPLADAELTVDIAVLHSTCACGLGSEVNSEDLVGHMFICPQCGAVSEISEAHDLELIEVIAETESRPDEVQV